MSTRSIGFYEDFTKTTFQSSSNIILFLSVFSHEKISVLLNHRVSHSDDRPYACPCGMRFKSSSCLLQHKKTHSGTVLEQIMCMFDDKYRKVPKFSDARKLCCNPPKIKKEAKL